MKRVAALMMVKNEIDVIESNINYLLTQDIDDIYVFDNLSTDGTTEKLYTLSFYDKVTVKTDPEVAYYQADKMNSWANDIFQEDIDVIIPIDADEIWYSKESNYTLGEVIKNTDADVFVASSEDYIPTIFDNSFEPNFIKRIKHKKVNSDSFNGVAFSNSSNFWLDMGNHDVLNHPGKRVFDKIGIRHYQYRSFDQFVNKVRNGKKAYDQTNFPDYMGSHWRKLGSMSDIDLKKYWIDYCGVETVESLFVAKNYA